jgi:hypothetical protein
MTTPKLELSRGSRKIVEGNFKNLGSRHGRKTELSLEARVDNLRTKYQKGSSMKQQYLVN